MKLAAFNLALLLIVAAFFGAAVSGNLVPRDLDLARHFFHASLVALMLGLVLLGLTAAPAFG